MVPVLTDCKRVQEARQLLLAMLARTHVEGYIRLFLEEGTPMLNLLRSLLPQIREKLLLNYLQTVLLAFDQGQRPGQSASTLRQQMLPDPLSPQELRVLRLLVAGRSNAEIASELVVSINTIRTQVSSIYRKLAVSGRFEASAVARNLGIVTD
jgi:LuxR family maltose regulon positive regulatory protein